nr:uncharacterized protein LOC109759582 [Aegilops tauschii subsp. strangulata]
MHGTVTGEASAAELVGVAYARASKPTNAFAASSPGAGGHNYKGASASAVLARLAGGNRWHQDDDGGKMDELQEVSRPHPCASVGEHRGVMLLSYLLLFVVLLISERIPIHHGVRMQLIDLHTSMAIHQHAKQVQDQKYVFLAVYSTEPDLGIQVPRFLLTAYRLN